uniref:Uncharacterized protein n=1 Tax=Romanomermis culicivorax TaxID=13658 RepID=A0A915KK53_ROMCU
MHGKNFQGGMFSDFSARIEYFTKQNLFLVQQICFLHYPCNEKILSIYIPSVESSTSTHKDTSFQEDAWFHIFLKNNGCRRRSWIRSYFGDSQPLGKINTSGRKKEKRREKEERREKEKKSGEKERRREVERKKGEDERKNKGKTEIEIESINRPNNQPADLGTNLVPRNTSPGKQTAFRKKARFANAEMGYPHGPNGRETPENDNYFGASR